ncbi:hypothetical protein LMG27198_47040 [Methylocystis echinoides]|uniref:Uncharacterized protein n=1 Tax=Methylocystis echinoides TaxID=29468 RepID=A0A9W6GZ03_9HYPH|nr:hypothetical protein LMG27198_47040 [Methylocystis echinoides]
MSHAEPHQLSLDSLGTLSREPRDLRRAAANIVVHAYHNVCPWIFFQYSCKSLQLFVRSRCKGEDGGMMAKIRVVPSPK